MTEPTFEQPLDDVDFSLLRTLRGALDSADPMPADLDERVEFALTVQALQAEIAELQRLPGEPVGTRSHVYERVDTVTFTSSGMSAVVTISQIGHETARVDGWIDGDATEVELRERHRTSTVGVGTDGRFAFTSVERGLVQLVFRFSDPGANPVITPSMEV